MSKGSPRVTVRLPQDLLDQVAEIIARSRHTRFAGPFDESEFIRIATVEKIKKMERSRTWRGAKNRKRVQLGYQVETSDEFVALGPPVSLDVDTSGAAAVECQTPTGG